MWRLKYEELEELGLLSYFKFFEVRGIAKKLQGSIENLGTKINLSTKEPKIETRMLETDSILAFDFGKIEEFAPFLKRLIETKELEVAGRRISYEKSLGHLVTRRTNDGVMLESYKETIPIEESIDEEFRKLGEPYDGFYDFCNNYLGRGVGGGTCSWIEVRIPLDEILSFDVHENSLRIKTQVDPKDIELSIIAHIENGTTFRTKEKLVDSNVEEGKFVFDLPEKTRTVIVFPLYKEKQLGRMDLTLTSNTMTPLRVAILEILNMRYPDFVSEEDLVAEMMYRFPSEQEIEKLTRKEMMPSSTFLRTHGYIIVHEISDGATFEAKITSIGSNFLAELYARKRREIETEATILQKIFLSQTTKIPRSLVSIIKDKKTRFCVFLGAGATKSAGLLLGDELRNVILQKIYNKIDLNENLENFRKEYSHQIDEKQEITLEMVMQGLRERYGDTAYELLKGFVDENKHSPEGYWSLSRLTRNKFFDVVFTTNFDELLEKSLDEDIGRMNYELLCTSDSFKSFRPKESLEKPYLIKLHGTYSLPSTLIATWDDVQELSKYKTDFLDYYSTYYFIIFVGYSGKDPDIRKILHRASSSKRTRVFWVSPNDLEATAQEILGWFESKQNYIRVSSDEFFNELEDHLISSEDRLQNEVDTAILLRLNANSEEKAVSVFQIASAILNDEKLGPEVRKYYHGSVRRLIKDIIASCNTLLKEGRLDGCIGDGINRRYWD